MFWMIPAATALLGAAKSNESNRARKANNEAAAAQTRYSSWSGLGPGQIDTRFDNPLMGGISGAIGGLGAMQALGGAQGIQGLFGGGGGDLTSQVAGQMQSAPQYGLLDQQYNPVARSTWNIS